MCVCIRIHMFIGMSCTFGRSYTPCGMEDARAEVINHPTILQRLLVQASKGHAQGPRLVTLRASSHRFEPQIFKSKIDFLMTGRRGLRGVGQSGR